MTAAQATQTTREVANSGSDTDSTRCGPDGIIEKIDQVNSNERVENPNYYNKDGLRTYGDGLDHDHEPAWTASRILSLVAMGFLFTGSQIPVFLFGGCVPYVYGDIGGTDRWVWLILANLLSLAAVCPFVGSLSDLIGRRYVALSGSVFLVIGMIVCGRARSMNIFICGMSLSGIGAGVCELTAVAVTAELAPTRKRGIYVAVLVLTILPFCPSVMWAQLIAYHAGWRFIALFCGVWAMIGLVGTAAFYHPPPRPNSRGLTKMQIIGEIDFVGGFLSISGMITFVAGMQWGGYQYPWKSPHVLVPLVLGAFTLLVAFPVWEVKFAKHPMFPSRMRKEARTFTLTLIITFISGANFFSVLMFWPVQAFNVYGHDPIGVGLRGLPIGFAILTGACVCLVLLSVLRGYNRALLIVSSCAMTAGCGALAVGKVDNMNVMYGLLVLAGLGIGGIVVPASIMTTIICPDDLIATVAALTLSIRVIGGCIGYSTYFNVFINKFIPYCKVNIGYMMVFEMQIYNISHIVDACEYTGASLLELLKTIPEVGMNQTRYDLIVAAGQLTYAESYKYVYLASIGFGGIAILASLFLGDINEYMDDHVAVVM